MLVLVGRVEVEWGSLVGRPEALWVSSGRVGLILL